MDDTRLIHLYQTRSESAITETHQTYGGYLNETVYRILNDPQDTEEVVNDTYLSAWNAIPPTIPRSFRHFLVRIARNLAFDRLDYRRAGRRRGEVETLSEELAECLPDHRATPEQECEERALTAAVNDFLQKLERQDCALFVARYFYALPLTELARKTGLTRRKLQYRLTVTRQKLKQYLEQEGFI